MEGTADVLACASDAAAIVEDIHLQRNYNASVPEAVAKSLIVPASLRPEVRSSMGPAESIRGTFMHMYRTLSNPRVHFTRKNFVAVEDNLPALRPMSLNACHQAPQNAERNIADCLRVSDKPIVSRALVSANICAKAAARYSISSLAKSRRPVLVRVSPSNVFVFCRSKHTLIAAGVFSPPSVTRTIEEHEFAARCTESRQGLPPIAFSGGGERVYLQSELSEEDCLVEPLLQKSSDLAITQRERVWVSTKGTVSALHYDASNSVLIQLAGHKRMVLFHPDTLPEQGVYPLGHPLHRRARVDLTLSRNQANEQLFSGFWNLRAVREHSIEVTLGPGDVCTFPAGYVACDCV